MQLIQLKVLEKIQTFYMNDLCAYQSMLRIGVEILPPAPDNVDSSITDVNRFRPHIFCALAS